MKELIKRKLNIRTYLGKLGFDTSNSLTECKFHNSQNKKDFSWNSEMYHCFGCGEKGDVFNLIAKLNNLDIKRDFIKILSIAAKDAGVKLELNENYSKNLEKEKEKEDKLKRNHTLFLNWCINQLDQSQKNYIMNNRDLKEETIKRFKIGYLPNSKVANLKKYLKDNGVEDDLIEKYTYLSERHIIPFLRNGEPIHFVGHKLPSHPNKDAGKYVVMNATYSVDKHKPLFNETDIYNTKTLLITEGFYDTIAVSNINYNGLKIKTIGFGTNNFSKNVLEKKGYLFSKIKNIVISFDNEKNNQGLKGSIATAINLLRYNPNIYINQINRENEDKLDICDALKKYNTDETKYNYVMEEIIQNKKNTKHIFEIIAKKIKDEDILEQMNRTREIYDSISSSPEYDIILKQKIIDDFNTYLVKEKVSEKKTLNLLKAEYLKKREDLNNSVEIKRNEEDNRERILLNTLIQDPYEIIDKVFDKVPMAYDDTGILHIWSEENKRYEIKSHDFIIDYNFENHYYVYDKPISQAETRGIIHRVIHQAATKYYLERLNLPEKNWISFKDCVIDIKTGKVVSKNVKDYFMHNTIPYEILPEENKDIDNIFEYYKNKELPTEHIDTFFKEWVTDKEKSDEENKKNTKLLYETAAYTLYPGYPFHRIFCLIGTGRNGKSKYVEIIQKMLGNHNYESKKITDLSTNRFSKVGLYKKLMCPMGEATYSDKTNEAILKEITGEDIIDAEMKNIQKPIQFVNYAKIFLNTQDIPATSDYSDGYMRRWIIISFPNEFPQKGGLLDCITDEEMKNFTIKSLFILNDLIQREGEVIFENEGTIKQKRRRFERIVNPTIDFIEQYCKQGPGEYMKVVDFYALFNKYQQINKMRMLSEKQIKDNLQHMGIYYDRINIDGNRPGIFRGISCELTANEITEEVSSQNQHLIVDYNKFYSRDELIPVLKDKFPTLFKEYDMMAESDKEKHIDKIISELKKNVGELTEHKEGYKFVRSVK